MNETEQFDSDKFAQAINAYQQADSIETMTEALTAIQTQCRQAVILDHQEQEEGAEATSDPETNRARAAFWDSVVTCALPSADTRAVICAAGNTIGNIPYYLQDTAKSRLPDSTSTLGYNIDFTGTDWELIVDMFTGNTVWTERTDIHATNNCKAYQCAYKGVTSIIPIEELDDTEQVTLTQPVAAEDIKATITGKERKITDFIVAIVGPEDSLPVGPQASDNVIFTFLPGNPIVPNHLSSNVTADMIGKTITVAEAKSLGVKNVTIV